MKDRKMEKIWMPASTGVIYPIVMIPPNRLYLSNFAWFDYIRPLNKDDIFVWRPKKSGTELSVLQAQGTFTIFGSNQKEIVYGTL